MHVKANNDFQVNSVRRSDKPLKEDEQIGWNQLDCAGFDCFSFFIINGNEFYGTE